MESNVIAVMEAIENMLPPLPPKPKQCRDRSAHKGHQWSKHNDDRFTFAVAMPLITHEVPQLRS